MMIYTGSKALQYLSIPVFTIFKNVTIIIIAYLERIWYNGQPISVLISISFGLMVVSSIIAGLSDYHSLYMKQQGSFMIAYTWMFLNCFCTTAFTLSMKSTIKRVQFKDFDTVFFNSISM
jgi:GDP-mannose transporter